MKTLMAKIVFWALKLRYKTIIKGLGKIKDSKNILFLANHPALIDPVLLFTLLYPKYKTRTVADQFQINVNPFIKNLALLFGTRILPDLDRYGISKTEEIKQVLTETIHGLKQGENLLLYPAGHLKRHFQEEIKAASAVEAIIKEFPDVKIVLVRQNGLWGSIFSWGYSGNAPSLFRGIKFGLKHLFLNLLFFMPRREVIYEFYEAQDFPKQADRLSINKYLEDFFNEGAQKNTYVPYKFWEGKKAIIKPEPIYAKRQNNIEAVPPHIYADVIKYLENLTKEKNIAPEQHLAYDLGLDSLGIVDIIIWLEKEFGFPAGNPDSLQYVSDVMLAAIGQGVVNVSLHLKPVKKAWFKHAKIPKKLFIPSGNNIAEVFLKKAKENPNQIIVADETSGAKSFREIILGVLIFKEVIYKLPGEYVGIMLPASVGTILIYLAIVFTGKIPVMINWTGGKKGVLEALELIPLNNIITSQLFLEKLKERDFDFTEFQDKFILLEEEKTKITKWQKINGLIKSYFNWAQLKKAKINNTAVILFTSGSESKPKAVPLSHKNILTNIKDVLTLITLYDNDSLLGILPPFHSFGITATTILPLISGVKTVYHPNPIEANILGKIIENYKCTFMVGTPTFLNNIVQISSGEQLTSLRMAVTGAEKCSKTVYDLIAERCPQLKIIEGYGITECSPIVSANNENEPHYYTIGKILPSLEYQILHPETGQKVKKGEMGILIVRGDSVFDGYINYHGKSPFVEFAAKNWYYTGDLVKEDQDDVLTFCGRLKRFIKMGGEMISLPAIETVLEPYFKKENAEGPTLAVEALEHQEIPEIILFSTINITRSEVNKIIQEAGFSALHNIREVMIVNEIPLLGTGKTNYRALKEMFKSSEV